MNKNSSSANTDYLAMSDFCSYFHKITAEGNTSLKNTLVSPLSAYIALLTLKTGARKNTHEQLEKVLGNTNYTDILALISRLTSLEETTLNIANSVWVDNAFTPCEAFVTSLENEYAAEVFGADLKNAEKHINAWIENKTNGLIKDVFSDSALDSSVMALINTVYLKVAWLWQFSPEVTSKRIFKNADGSEALTDFMYRKAFYKVIEAKSYIGVSLPYSDGALEFVAVMPKGKSTSAADAVNSIFDNGGWQSVLEASVEEKIELYIPKFKQEMKGSLTEIIKGMGITDAFSPYLADFTGIAENIFVNSILQSAVLKIDEGGTEAAAATVIEIALASLPMPEPEPRVIEFNRPFAFAVIDNVTGVVLFSGEHNSAV